MLMTHADNFLTLVTRKRLMQYHSCQKKISYSLASVYFMLHRQTSILKSSTNIKLEQKLLKSRFKNFLNLMSIIKCVILCQIRNSMSKQANLSLSWSAFKLEKNTFAVHFQDMGERTICRLEKMKRKIFLKLKRRLTARKEKQI